MKNAHIYAGYRYPSQITIDGRLPFAKQLFDDV
jgi:hypothetical protein